MQLANDPATVVDLNLFKAGFAVQQIFVIGFNAQLSDVVRRGVVRPYALFVEACNVTIVDF